MEDVNQVAASLAAAVFASQKAPASRQPHAQFLTISPSRQIAQLFWEVRKELIATQPGARDRQSKSEAS